MRILHITPQYHPARGGAETYTKEISERLIKRGHDVTVLTLNSSGGSGSSGNSLTDATVINEVHLRRFLPTGRLQGVVSILLKTRGAHRLFGAGPGMDRMRMLADSPYGLRAFHLSVRSRPDVVAVINWYGGSLAYQTCLARRSGAFALVGVPLFHTEFDWSHSALYGPMLARCDAVVTLTEHEKAFVDQRSTVNNAHVVGVGVDPAVFAGADGTAIRSRHGIGDAPLVGYVGRMVPSKGVVTLIEAMKIIWRTHPDVRLLLAGPGLPTSPDCQADVAEAFAGLSGADRSRIIGIDRFNDDEKGSIFDALDVFAMPSIAESFGIAYLEAWVRNKAVIGARIGSTQCVIEDGVDGLLVTPRNPDDLANAILRLLSDRATREQMGRAGYAKMRTHFTWDRITDKVEHVYRDAMSRSRSGCRRGSTVRLGVARARETRV
jgi:phosphatidylinositol alpha-1,6-mannosyltransferase